MLSLPHLERMVAAERWGPLLDRVLANGRPVSQVDRLRLSRPEAVAAAALGLALQRACELSYAPDRGCESIAGRLLRLRRPDGLFGAGAAGDPAATAIAVRGLAEWRRLHEESGAAPPAGLDATIETTVRALVDRLRRSPVASPPPSGAGPGELIDTCNLGLVGYN